MQSQILASILDNAELVLTGAEQGHSIAIGQLLLLQTCTEWGEKPTNAFRIIPITISYLTKAETLIVARLMLNRTIRSLIKTDTNPAWAGFCCLDMLGGLVPKFPNDMTILSTLSRELYANMDHIMQWIRFSVEVAKRFRRITGLEPPLLSAGVILERLLLVKRGEEELMSPPMFQNIDLARMALELWFAKDKGGVLPVQGIEGDGLGMQCPITGLLTRYIHNVEQGGRETLLEVLQSSINHPSNSSDVDPFVSFAEVFVARVVHLTSISEREACEVGSADAHLGLFVVVAAKVAHCEEYCLRLWDAFIDAGVISAITKATASVLQRLDAHKDSPIPLNPASSTPNSSSLAVRMLFWQQELWKMGTEDPASPLKGLQDIISGGVITIIIFGFIKLLDEPRSAEVEAMGLTRDDIWQSGITVLDRILVNCVYPSFLLEAHRQIVHVVSRPHLKIVSDAFEARVSSAMKGTLEDTFLNKVEGWIRMRRAILECEQINVSICDNEEHGTSTIFVENDAKYYTCSGCSSAVYCSKKCQHKHWLNGHRAECGDMAEYAEIHEVYPPKLRAWHLRLLAWLYLSSGAAESHLQRPSSHIAILDMTSTQYFILIIPTSQYPDSRRALTNIVHLETRFGDFLEEIAQSRHIETNESLNPDDNRRYAEIVIPYGPLVVSLLAKLRIRKVLDEEDLEVFTEVDVIGSFVRIGKPPE